MPKSKLASNTVKIGAERTQTLSSHRSYLGDAQKIDIESVSTGDVIMFMYNGEERTVFILDPSHEMKLHGLSMNSIDRRTMMVEVFAKKDLFESPTQFYEQVIKQPVIQNTDSYRTYFVNKIGNLRRLTYKIDERGREEL